MPIEYYVSQGICMTVSHSKCCSLPWCVHMYSLETQPGHLAWRKIRNLWKASYDEPQKLSWVCVISVMRRDWLGLKFQAWHTGKQLGIWPRYLSSSTHMNSTGNHPTSWEGKPHMRGALQRPCLLPERLVNVDWRQKRAQVSPERRVSTESIPLAESAWSWEGNGAEKEGAIWNKLLHWGPAWEVQWHEQAGKPWCQSRQNWSAPSPHLCPSAGPTHHAGWVHGVGGRKGNPKWHVSPTWEKKKRTYNTVILILYEQKCHTGEINVS